MWFLLRRLHVSRVQSFIILLITCKIAAGICQNHCMILYVYIGDVADVGGVLTFYIPAIIDDEI